MLYGYSYYSDYIGTGATSSWQPYTGFDSGDYELSAHTRGLSATFEDQLTPKHLLEVQGSFTTSNALRMYNEQMFNSPGAQADQFAVLVNPNNVNRGVCYAIPGYSSSSSSSGSFYQGPARPTSCDPGDVLTVNDPATFAHRSRPSARANRCRISTASRAAAVRARSTRSRTARTASTTSCIRISTASR